jgi:hypothetical protein
MKVKSSDSVSQSLSAQVSRKFFGILIGDEFYRSPEDIEDNKVFIDSKS